MKFIEIKQRKIKYIGCVQGTEPCTSSAFLYLSNSDQAVAVHRQKLVSGCQPAILPGGSALNNRLDVNSEPEILFVLKIFIS